MCIVVVTVVTVTTGLFLHFKKKENKGKNRPLVAVESSD